MNYRYAFLLWAILAAARQVSAAGALTVTVDVSKERRPISPLIYGINYEGQGGEYTDILKQPFEASAHVVSDLNASIVRNGGNLGSRYNWEMNSTNHASDFYYESLTADGAATDDQRDSDVFVRIARAGGAEPTVTIPMIDWLSKVTPNGDLLPSFSVAKYGAQDDQDPDHPDAGNGLQNGIPIITNDKNDASVPNSVAFEQNFVDYLEAHPSGRPPLKYFTLDNEPDLWSNTHADVVHPNGGFANGKFDPNNENDKSTAEAARIAAFAKMIKARVPGALILGPETSSYFGYAVSPFDRQYANNLDANNDPNAYSSYPLDGDLAGHYRADGVSSDPDVPYMPWLLGQLHTAQGDGPRVLDYFTLHYYSDGVSLSLNVSAAAQAKRSSSTRLLWDDNFAATVDGADQVNLRLIRRMHEWVNANYPGTKLGITEYNWGAENHINGATTLADVLGIFGREGLDLATAFPFPPAPVAGDPEHTGFTYSAFKMYRNYDGKKSTFGDTHVQLTPMPDPDKFGLYAAQRSSDGKLTIMLVNKGAANVDVQVNLAKFTAGNTPELWQLTGATSVIRALPANSATLTASQLKLNLPAQSVTLAVIPKAGSASPSQLQNLSTRKQVGTGANVLIGGFIVTGTEDKKVLLRGLGPSLPVAGRLADPVLELHRADTTLLAANNNWKDRQAAEITATGIPPSKDLESALIATLAAKPANQGGAGYTGLLAGHGGGTGIGLLEIYDLNLGANSKLANISTRGFVGSGNDLLIGGFIPGPSGRAPLKVLVRALGPSLTAQGVAGALQDPLLELHDVNGTLLTNDNWKDASNAAEIKATLPPSDNRESAIITTLAPSNSGYTAVVRGVNGATGVALVEVYALQ